MTDTRLPAYADENIDARIIEAPRVRGFDILTNDLQTQLHRGAVLPTYGADEVQIALGQAAGGRQTRS